MEVWALEGYGAANVLQEILTVKSDDIRGRDKTYERIVKGQSLVKPGVPESFRVLVKELQGLGLDVEVQYDDGSTGGMAMEDDDEERNLRKALSTLPSDSSFFDEKKDKDKQNNILDSDFAARDEPDPSQAELALIDTLSGNPNYENKSDDENNPPDDMSPEEMEKSNNEFFGQSEPRE